MNLVREFSFSKNHKIYKYIKSVLKGDSFPPYSYTSAYLDLDKATLFKDYFHSVFSISTYDLPSENSIPRPDSVLSNITITDMDVYEALVSLDTTKSPGHDLIGPNILKCGALSLCCPTVHHLFTLCLSQHSIPMEWKIIPVFKVGNKSIVKDYRSI